MPNSVTIKSSLRKSCGLLFFWELITVCSLREEQSGRSHSWSDYRSCIPSPRGAKRFTPTDMVRITISPLREEQSGGQRMRTFLAKNNPLSSAPDIFSSACSKGIISSRSGRFHFYEGSNFADIAERIYANILYIFRKRSIFVGMSLNVLHNFLGVAESHRNDGIRTAVVNSYSSGVLVA